MTGGSGRPSPSSGSISAFWSSGWEQPRQLFSREDVASSGADSLLCLEKSTMTASGGSWGRDCLLAVSASSAGSFSLKDLLRPGRRKGGDKGRPPRTLLEPSQGARSRWVRRGRGAPHLRGTSWRG